MEKKKRKRISECVRHTEPAIKDNSRSISTHFREGGVQFDDYRQLMGKTVAFCQRPLKIDSLEFAKHFYDCYNEVGIILWKD